jgi:hypothetical protein
MRPHHGVRTLAAVLTAAAITAPAAQANFGNFYAPYTPLNSAAVHHADGTTDWTLIGLSAAGGVTLLGAGATTSRRLRRRDPSVGGIRAARGS